MGAEASIGVVGAGAWGTALAQALASDGTPVILWARETDVAHAIRTSGENPRFLPGVRLSPALSATDRLEDLAKAALWLVAVPAQHLGAVLAQAPLGHRPHLVLCAKGIEAGTGRLMTEVAEVQAPGCRLAVLSGPSFAADVAHGRPTAVTLAARSLADAETLARRLARPHLRPYLSDDPVGAQVGGAVKNVLAIACGIVVGADLGESARAALVARGFAEMTRFAVARGGRAATVAGLSGLGDLVLTCSSPRSRNMALGIALGQGRCVADALAGLPTVAEGVSTAPVLVAEARRLRVEMPIAEAVADLLQGRIGVSDAMARLLARPLRREDEG
ncbi:MAG: NAD(P)-dependent glycerol-3-phosphate dehydrogenase [Sphingomonadaceae bacterium]|uniref:NAD(P)H-dependent glycerol-3-phosphate dehydrogenase n=1 Tax=Thermaurantiacus sp. TaxID=2820283 RepID=UPI00298F0629|nr:NAD(P)H-dependent glycerol-3-phosphate dehydrogenase [Thermaurantiacus sp.]MCS6987448.1 NAD(P)-dependent glycerol-3-phosphate dehydrogenase [Sphingomonadaceae bacterium]MDW8415368.1 NAD(P)H-dependent glycerol-3-phosphate dehydrogenase [Thermaurantiacus sp.]